MDASLLIMAALLAVTLVVATVRGGPSLAAESRQASGYCCGLDRNS
jgi:hypothetical protein